MIEAQLKRCLRLILAAEAPRPILFKWGADNLLVHRDHERRGAWRITAFSGDEPVGHTSRASWGEIVDELAWYPSLDWASRRDVSTSTV